MERAVKGGYWSLSLHPMENNDLRDQISKTLPTRAGPPTWLRGRGKSEVERSPSTRRPPSSPLALPSGWRLEVLEPPQDMAVGAGRQAHFSCTLSEVVPVGEATWYVNGTAVQPDDADWMVTADGSHHTLLLHRARAHHAGEVTFAARDAVASAQLTVLGGWLGCWTLPWVGRGRGFSSRSCCRLSMPPHTHTHPGTQPSHLETGAQAPFCPQAWGVICPSPHCTPESDPRAGGAVPHVRKCIPN